MVRGDNPHPRRMILAYTIYDACVAPLTHMLGSYSGFLTKAENYAKEKGIDPQTYLEARLIDDMFNLTTQVQIASDSVQGRRRPPRPGGDSQI